MITKKEAIKIVIKEVEAWVSIEQLENDPLYLELATALKILKKEITK